jgi:AraC-like DNA-binding protein
VEIPSFGCVSEASPDEPYFGIILGLDPAIMREVIEQLPIDTQNKSDVGEGLFVTDIEKPLADCMLRMLNLLDTPEAIPVLYPAIMREICYWLLTSPHGSRVAKITFTNPYTQKLTHAIHFLRKHYVEPIRIDELALIANLSPSAFHRQFKAFTSISPLQYQKQMRLLEARRLITLSIENIEKAAFQVGYESPSQFSREYSRMFGHPPSKELTSANFSISLV